MKDNEENQSNVAYETKGDKEVKDLSCMTKCQFPSNKMPQGNKMVKSGKSGKANHGRHKEHR